MYTCWSQNFEFGPYVVLLPLVSCITVLSILLTEEEHTGDPTENATMATTQSTPTVYIENGTPLFLPFIVLFTYVVCADPKAWCMCLTCVWLMWVHRL